MKNCSKSFFLVLLGMLFVNNFDAEQPAQVTIPAPAAAVQSKKLLLFGIKGVLFYPDLSKVKGGGIGALFGFTPDVVEKELFEILLSLHVNGLRGYTGTYPMLIEAWLTNQMTNEAAKEFALYHIKHNCGFGLKKMRLKLAAETAFSPYDSANVLSINHTVVSLAQSCKAKGHTIAICSSWNNDAFNALKQTHYSVFTQFDQTFISGNCGLACEGRFYDQILKNYKAEDIVLIDCLQENLNAAHQKGIKTIYCASLDSLQYELRKQGIL